MKLVTSLLLMSTISLVLTFDWKDGNNNAKWASGCDFLGSDIANVPNSPGDQCSDNCFNNGQCTHFTWFSGTCYLKHFDSPATATNLDGGVCGWINRNGPDPGPGPGPSGTGMSQIKHGRLLFHS